MLDTELLDQPTAIFVFNQRNDGNRENVKTFVGTDDNDMPIATVSLILERKFIYGGMLNGRIEDVAVHPDHRHEGLGTEIMEHTMEYAKSVCERVVLECKRGLETFYQTHDFKTHSIAMRQQNECLNKPDFSRKIEDHKETGTGTEETTETIETIETVRAEQSQNRTTKRVMKSSTDTNTDEPPGTELTWH